MSQDGHQVSIKILDKTFLIGCPDGAEAELFASADYLNQKMAEIKDTGRVLGMEKVAIMAALNISHELLKSREAQRSDVESRIQKLGEKIDRSLASMQHAEDISS